MKRIIQSALSQVGYVIRKIDNSSYPEKAMSFSGRFREILSDPLNVLIERHPASGEVKDGLVTLHTGIVVPVNGSGSYYNDFSEILSLNRGVHEPLEEFAFQQLVKRIGSAPTMLELGAYWAHYSMWLKQSRPNATVYLVEPDQINLQAGIDNFKRNGFEGTFVQAKVGSGHFEVDAFMHEKGLERLDILHSDIQGFEVEMLDGCARALRNGAISYCFVSTHSQSLHQEVMQRLRSAGFRIEASADVDNETTSFDGLVFAAHESAPPILKDFQYLGRKGICAASPEQIMATLERYVQVSSS